MLSLVVPVRDWPQERIDLCIEGFRSLGAKTLTEIIVVDFGSRVPVPTNPGRGPLRVVRVEAALWSLSEAINVGVASARNELIAKTDADILIGRGGRLEFDSIVGKLRRGEIGFAIAQATDLPPALSPSAAVKVVARTEDIGRLRPKWGQGGLVFFSRATWTTLGGFDSRFTGWGNEDNDFAERVRRAGLRTYWANRDKLSIFHIWHPPSHAATGVLNQRQRNQRIAKEDKSVFRSLTFRHSNFGKIAAPAVHSRFAPLVTLGIATTARPNRNRMLSEAIDSFKGQIDNDVEVLVVDNGSPPADSSQLEKMLARVKWARSTRLEVSAQASIPAARNLISSLARGRFICVVDDDDIALPNRLADHVRVFSADPTLHGSHGGWIDFDESTGVIERNQGKARLISTLLKGTGKITAHPASLYRADVMRAVPYDESLALGSDFDLALRLANNGFDIGHTNSYLTLRRYHSANVTITGQANQVSNGALARSRTLASFDWQKIGGLDAEAKLHNDEVYCRNQMSIESLAELIPGYTGHWQIYVPIAALAPTANADTSSEVVDASEQPPSSHLPDLDEINPSPILERVLSVVAGDLRTRYSGLNQPVYFRSRPIAGLKRARKLRDEVQTLLGLAVELNSVRQSEIDREVPFEWKDLTIKPGERILRSGRFTDLSQLMGLLLSIKTDSLLRTTLSVLSDFDERGECYYLATTAIAGIDRLRQVQFHLERRLKMPFQHVASQGVISELTPRTRSH